MISRLLVNLDTIIFIGMLLFIFVGLLSAFIARSIKRKNKTAKLIENEEFLNSQKKHPVGNGFEDWVDTALEACPFEDAEGIAFNIYQDVYDRFSLEVVATFAFDEEGGDWSCDEIWASRDDCVDFVLSSSFSDDAFEEAKGLIEKYLANDKAKYSKALKSTQGIGVGFVDGDFEVIYKNQSTKIDEEEDE